MMSEEEIRKELAMGNIVCPECSDSDDSKEDLDD